MSLPTDLFNFLPDAYLHLDLKGNCLAANRVWTELTGLSHQNSLQNGWKKAVIPEDTAELDKFLSNLASECEVEVRYKAKSNETRWMKFKSRPLPGGSECLSVAFDTNATKLIYFDLQARLSDSQKEFEALAENLPNLVWITGPAGEALYVNQKWKEYTGIGLINAGWDKLFHPDDVPRISKVWNEAVQKGTDYILEFRVRSKEGNFRWFLSVGRPLRDQNQKIQKWIGSMTDIHELKMAQETVEASQKRFVELADSMPQIVWTATPDGHLDYYNQRWFEFTGFSREQSAKPWEPIVHPDDLQRVADVWAKALRTGEPYEVEYRFWDYREKRYRWFLSQALPIRDSSGTIQKWYGTSTDIDLHKQAAEVTQKAQLAIESSKMKSEFLANMSHEIRTPLHGILGMTDIVLDSRLTPDQRESLLTVRQCGVDLKRLIDDVLDFSKIDAGKLDLEHIDFNLLDLIQETHKTVSLSALQKNLDIEIVIPELNTPFFKGDPLRIRQVLLNLLSNAIKFSFQGKIQLCLIVQDKGSRELVRFEVADRGIGISIEKQSQLFQPFFQADLSTSRRFGGSGLGLSICKNLVQLMGGRIGMQSEFGQGSTFWFELELEKSSLSRIRKNSPETLDSKFSKALRGKVLVVEDNAINQKVILSFLKKMDLETLAAESGTKAIEILQNEKCDLILMDCQMPGMDGYETTRNIRRDSYGINNPKIPIIALTANAIKGDREKCLAVGMNDYLSKPLTYSQLESCLRLWLNPQKYIFSAFPEPMNNALTHLTQETSLDVTLSALALFQTSSEKYLNALGVFWSTGDLQSLALEAQSWRSSAEILGALELVNLLKNLEESVESQAIEYSLQSIQKEVHDLNLRINQLLKENKIVSN